MAAGADKVIAFDPPGAIGLTDSDAVVLLRLHDTDAAIHPSDSAGALADLQPPTGTLSPTVVDAAIGKGRKFDASAPSALVAQDILPGASLLTRDVSIMAILAWDIKAQDQSGEPVGTILARGLGNAAAEYISYGLELLVVDVPSLTGEIRWVWQDTSGGSIAQGGANFTIRKDAFTLLTATRRWVSPTKVVLRYYIGDQLLGEVTSVNGIIGGGTTGTFCLGTRFSGGAPAKFLSGVLDEILILDHEITREEIEDTWLRITRYQPLGYQLIKEMHDPGFPLPSDPASDAQKDLRLTGHALGYAASLAENVRSNILPQRSYGEILEQWEEVLRVTPAPNQGVDDRRARVLARMRQRRGCSILGIEDILPSLLGGGTVDDLEFLAFSNEIDDAFTVIDPLRWDVTPAGAFVAVSGAASCQPGAGTYKMDGTTKTWQTMRQVVGGDGRQAHQLSKLVWATPQDTAEAGIYFHNACTGDYLLLGLRDVAGSFRVYSESFIANVSQGAVLQATIGANPAAIWLHLYQTSVDGTWKAAWSTTSGTASFTVSADVTHPTIAHWGGCYLRSTGALGAGPRADFDDHKMLAPFSGRPLNAYVLLDRGLGFTPDIAGADQVISAIKHAFTHAAFITNRVLLAGDPDSGAGLAPCGGY